MPLKAHLESSELSIESRADPRRHLLLETSGTLPSGEQANVVVHNVSATGMLLETTLALSVDERLAVEIPEAGLASARVVWASGMLFGCAFDERLGAAALSATELRASAPLPPEIGQPSIGRRATGELFGKRLENLRKQRGMTLAQVADQLGVSKPTVWAWEKGKARPVEERLPAIAAALGIEPNELASFSEPPGISELLETSRKQIAEAYGTTPDRVRIMIEV
ncbi:helix-turn-helix domain-containing protein [Altererythrobacter sp.]|uniref:helix-turn-helix domain-containing protein n=1 Tax=Altererythrobacter sp. TaxID=1872480 RepID=UPI003CFD3AD5